MVDNETIESTLGALRRRPLSTTRCDPDENCYRSFQRAADRSRGSEQESPVLPAAALASLVSRRRSQPASPRGEPASVDTIELPDEEELPKRVIG
jgi:hypothetical protein